MPAEKDSNLTTKDIMSFRSVKSLDKNYKFTFCYKKASKLLKAIYILTDSEYPPNKTLKDSIISTGHVIVKDIIDLFTGRRVSKNDLEGNILYVISLLDVASAGGVINENNGGILADEYQKLLGLIDGLENDEIYGFGGTDQSVEEAVNIGPIPQIPKILPKKVAPRAGAAMGADKPKTTKSPQIYQGQSKGHNVSYVTSVRGGDREKSIMEEIKKMGVVNIKDISAVLPNLSEKTVQRELLNMVAKGILKKEGERRWSKYSLT